MERTAPDILVPASNRGLENLFHNNLFLKLRSAVKCDFSFASLIAILLADKLFLLNFDFIVCKRQYCLVVARSFVENY